MKLFLSLLEKAVVVSKVGIFVSDTLCIDVISGFRKLGNIFVTEIDISHGIGLSVKSRSYHSLR